MTLLSKIRPLMALVGVFAYLIVSFGSFQQNVLCIESNGKVELQELVSGHCIDAFAPVANQSSLSRDKAHLQRRHCVDIPITFGKQAPHISSESTLEWLNEAVSVFETLPKIDLLRVLNITQLSNPPPFIPFIQSLIPQSIESIRLLI